MIPKIIGLILLTTLLFIAIYCKRVNIRKNTKDLTQEEWRELRRGLQLMKERSYKNRSDPLGFYFQANIHGWSKYDGSAAANRMADRMNWHRCQHGHYFFLVWHRMYLYFFERILQKVTQNPNITVPYWDYFDPDERALPEPFRIPADPSKNSLYARERCKAINEGMPLREELVNPYPALSSTFFSVDDNINKYHVCHSFGGAEVNGPKLIADKQGLLERIPHDYIHMFVGGPNGYMSDECRTARDPIFWLHHSQIDRLWESWIAMGGTDLKTEEYLNQTFDFYNSKGVRKTYKVIEFMNAKKLNYRYDKLLESEKLRKIQRINASIPEVYISAGQRDAKKLDIDANQMSIILNLEEDSRILFEKMAKNPQNYEKIRFSLQFSFSFIDSRLIYNMHMNLPNDTYPYENKPYFIGSLVYFQANCVPLMNREVMNVKKCFDVTENIKLIVKRNYIYSGEFTKFINITFVPKSCEDIILTNSIRKFRSDDYLIRFNEIHLLHYISY